MIKLRSKQITLPIAALLLVLGTAFAQQQGMHEKGEIKEGMYGCRMSENNPMIPDLTKEQQEQIKTLRIKHMEAMQSLRNQMAEKKARQRTLSTADKVNMTEINKVIDDIGAMQTQMMKLREEHRQDIRKLLNDEQRVMFDAHQPPHGRLYHEGMHPEKKMH